MFFDSRSSSSNNSSSSSSSSVSRTTERESALVVFVSLLHYLLIGIKINNELSLITLCDARTT